MPIDDYACLIAQSPSIVPWRSDHHVPGSELFLRPVVHDHLHSAREEVSEVGRLAAVGLRDRLYMLRPAPSRLKSSQTDRPALEVNKVDLALVDKGSRLVGGSQALLDKCLGGCIHLLGYLPWASHTGLRRQGSKRPPGDGGDQEQSWSVEYARFGNAVPVSGSNADLCR